MHTVARTALLLTAALCATGCGITDSDPWEVRRSTLEHSRATWQAAGIDRYAYTLDLSCYCAVVGELRVTVEDGEVVAAQPVQADHPLPAEELRFVHTVADLFDVIERAIDDEAYVFQARYHPTLGYPTLIDLDPIRDAIDDELTLHASSLAPLP